MLTRSKFWRTFTVVTVISILIGVFTGVHNESISMGFLGYFAAAFIGVCGMMFQFAFNQMVSGEDDGRE